MHVATQICKVRPVTHHPAFNVLRQSQVAHKDHLDCLLEYICEAGRL